MVNRPGQAAERLAEVLFAETRDRQGHGPGRARCQRAVTVADGLRFDDAVIARREVVEAVEPGRIGRGGDGRVVSGRVQIAVGAAADERDDDTRQNRVAGAVAVAAVVAEHVARQAGAAFADVVGGARLAGADRDAAEAVVRRGVRAQRSGRVGSVSVEGGLRLGDVVGARNQEPERVVAINIGGRGQAHGVAEDIDAHEGDEHAGNPHFGAAEDAVVVVVAVDGAREGTGAAVAVILVEPILARRQGEVRGVVEGAVRIEHLDDARDRQRHGGAVIVARPARLVHRQPLEQVRPVGVGGGREGQVVGGVEHAVVARPLQHHHGTGDRRFAGIAGAVGVAVQPDEIADRRISAVAEVDVRRRFAVGQGPVGAVRRAESVEVVSPGEIQRPRRRVDDGPVVPGGQAREQIAAIRAGGGRRRDVVAVAEDAVLPREQQEHSDAGQARLRGQRALHAVVVGVEPNAVAQGAVAAVAEVLVQILNDFHVQRHRRFAVEPAVRIDGVGHRGRQGRRDHPDGVGDVEIVLVGRRQVAEQIVAVRVGRRREGVRRPVRIDVADEQHRDVGDPFARRRQAVAVEVEEDRVADSADAPVGEILTQVDRRGRRQRDLRRAVESAVRIDRVIDDDRQRGADHGHRVDDVGAGRVRRRQAVEQILSGGIGGRRERGERAVAVDVGGEGHQNPGQQLARLCNAVAVLIEEDGVADLADAAVTEILQLIARRGRGQCRRRRVIAGAGGVRIDGVGHARRQRRRVHRHGVRQARTGRPQVRELVKTSSVGGRRQRFRGAVAVEVARQPDDDSAEAFAGVRHAVGILVEENRIADCPDAPGAEIAIRIAHARGRRRILARRGGDLRRPLGQRRRIENHAVQAGDQARERIGAVGIGGGRGDGGGQLAGLEHAVGTGVIQPHDGAGDVRFRQRRGSVLGAVGVRVVEDRIADDDRAVHPLIDAVIGLVRHEHGGHARGHVAVAVVGGSRLRRILDGPGVPDRRGEGQHVAAGIRRPQVVERIRPTGDGGGRQRDRLPAVVGARQGDDDPDEARLAAVLSAVAVGVFPDEVAECGGEDLAEVVVDARLVVAQPDGDAADGVAVARVARGRGPGSGSAEGDARSRGARSVAAIEEACGLVRLGDNVNSRPQAGEVVGAVGGGLRHGHAVAEVVGAGQYHRDRLARDEAFSTVEGAVVVGVAPNVAADAVRVNRDDLGVRRSRGGALLGVRARERVGVDRRGVRDRATRGDRPARRWPD